MKYAATLFTASLVLIPAAASAQIDTAASPITLSDAILMAQRNAPSAVQARGSIRTANATVKQSYAAFLPSINLSAGSQREVPLAELSALLVHELGGGATRSPLTAHRSPNNG